MSAALEERLRRPDSSVRLICIAQATAKNANGRLREHQRKRQDEWQEADDVAGLDLLPEGDVRLHDNIVTLVSSTTHPNTFTDLDLAPPHDALTIDWGGTESNDLELQRLKLWLIPRVSGAASREVVKWKVELMRVVGTLRNPYTDPSGSGTLVTLAPLCDTYPVPVVGDAAGEVVFDFTNLPVRPQPKKWGAPTGQPASQYAAAVPPYSTNPVTVILVRALNATGGPASNAGLGYDAGVASAGTGNVLKGRHFRAPSTPGLGDALVETGSAGGTPHAVIETGTYTSKTLTFANGTGRKPPKGRDFFQPALAASALPSGSGVLGPRLSGGIFGGGSFILPSYGTNQFDLGGTPTADVFFTITGSVPTGCALTGQVLKDGGDATVDGDWVTFTSGQKSTDLVNVGKRQLYAMRAKLLTNAGTGSNLTPTLTALGVQEVTEVNLDHLCRVAAGDWHVADDEAAFRKSFPGGFGR